MIAHGLRSSDGVSALDGPDDGPVFFHGFVRGHAFVASHEAGVEQVGERVQQQGRDLIA